MFRIFLSAFYIAHYASPHFTNSLAVNVDAEREFAIHWSGCRDKRNCPRHITTRPLRSVHITGTKCRLNGT